MREDGAAKKLFQLYPWRLEQGERQSNPQHAIEIATAAGCLAHTIEGDFNLITLGEIATLMDDEDTTGRVRR